MKVQVLLPAIWGYYDGDTDVILCSLVDTNVLEEYAACIFRVEYPEIQGSK